MEEQLSMLFDQAGPEELDAVLGEDFEEEPLDKETMTRIQAKVLSAVETRRRPRRADFWVVAAVLAVVLGAGGLAMLHGGWSSGAGGSLAGLPDEYDVFSDPNVLWGDWEPAVGQDELRPGEVKYGRELGSLLEQADEQDLIAFRILTNSAGDGYPVRTDRLVIHEELAQCEELTYWIDHADSVGAYTQMVNAVGDFVYERVHEAEGKMVLIEQEVQDDLAKERGDELLTDDERDALEQEAKALCMEREDYRALYEMFSHYTSMEEAFDASMKLQLAEAVRDRFIGRGFTPVYEFDFDEAMGGDSAERAAWVEKAVTFVATAEQIRHIENVIGGDEIYEVLTAAEDLRAEG